MLQFGLIGETLAHSHSPQLHHKLLEQKGLQGTYRLLEIPSAQFDTELPMLLKQGFDGLNVTIPYKEKVIPFLDALSPQAEYIGAVNTIAFEHGKTIGYNTDYLGFRSMLEKAGIGVKGKNAVILGTGGAAKAVLKALLDMGVCDVTFVSRSKVKFHNQYAVSYGFFQENVVETDLLINCTPVGMGTLTGKSPLEKNLMKASVAIDLIYNPKETQFLSYAKELGMTALNGAAMLHDQAAEAQKIWLNEV